MWGNMKFISSVDLSCYSRFQVTFQSAFPKFVLNIPNYITKFGILRENLQSEICMLVNQVLKYPSTELKY